MKFISVFFDGEQALLITARSVNLCFGIIMCIVVWFLAVRIFDEEKRYCRFFFWAAVNFLPQQLFLHTYVNTDSMCMLSLALIIYALVCMEQDGVKIGNCEDVSIWWNNYPDLDCICSLVVCT